MSNNIINILQKRAQQFPEKLAYTYLVDGENQEIDISYQQLDHEARKIGAYLDRNNLKGERALLVYPSGIDYICAFFGCLYAGVIAVPVYPPHSKDKASLQKFIAILKDCSASVICCSSSTTGYLQTIPAIRIVETDKQPQEYDKWQPHSQQEIAFLQYTSGSTGSPKGVIVSHQNIMVNLKMMQSLSNNDHTCINVSWLPIYHDMGLVGKIISSIHTASRLIFLSPQHFLGKPFLWLKAISKYRGTCSAAPNFAYNLCASRTTKEELNTLDLSCWKLAICGAEPVHAKTAIHFSKIFESVGFAPEAFTPCYGLAESTLIVSGGSKEKLPVIKNFSKDALSKNEVKLTTEDFSSLISSGNSFSSQQTIAIVDTEHNTKCPENTIGEIWLKGGHIAKGYWGENEQNSAFNACLPNDKEPFFRTGDLGFFHEGELFVTGRLKDLIIIRGKNYLPQDIELVTEQSHSFVRPGCTAAFSIVGEEQEELVIIAEIKNQEDKPTDLDEVAQIIHQEITSFFGISPQFIVFIESKTIPKTSSGKIRRQTCRDLFLANKLSVKKQWQNIVTTKATNSEMQKQVLQVNEISDQAISIIAEIGNIPADKLGAKTNNILSELGFDSLQVLTIKDRVEKQFSCQIDTMAFAMNPTINFLIDQIIQKKT